MPRRTIFLISLGGTITMTSGGQAGIVPTLSANDLVNAVPGLDAVAGIEAVTLMRKPSASLDFHDLFALAGAIEAAFARGLDGAVVIQGTDTIEETAFVLDRLIGDAKPIVVTGAMRGPEEPGADGPRNVLSATIVAASTAARDLGTLVVLNDEIHAARFVQKAHTALPSAFRSPLSGPIGLVAEGSAHFHVRVPRAATLRRTTTPDAPHEGREAPVALLTMALGDDGRLLAALPDLGFAGAVISGMGAGHVPAGLAEIVSTVADAMPVVLAARTDTGPAFTRTYGYPGSEIDLIARGCIPAGTLPAIKARLLLTLLLRAGTDRAGLLQAFAAS